MRSSTARLLWATQLSGVTAAAWVKRVSVFRQTRICDRVPATQAASSATPARAPSQAHRRQGNSVDLHSFPFRAQHGAAPAVSFLHEVASAPTFVAAMGIEQLLPGQREIDAHVAQHQYQKVALHGLSYFEQAQGGPPPGVLAHPPPLPEADLEQSDKDQLGIDQSLDLALGARRHFGQCKITLPRLEDRFDAPAQTIDLSYGLG